MPDHLFWQYGTSCHRFIYGAHLYICLLVICIKNNGAFWRFTRLSSHTQVASVPLLQPVPERMRLEMLVETEIKILHGQSSCLFSNEPIEKRPGMTIEDFGLDSDDHFESHVLKNGL